MASRSALTKQIQQAMQDASTLGDQNQYAALNDLLRDVRNAKSGDLGALTKKFAQTTAGHVNVVADSQRQYEADRASSSPPVNSAEQSNHNRKVVDDTANELRRQASSGNYDPSTASQTVAAAKKNLHGSTSDQVSAQLDQLAASIAGRSAMPAWISGQMGASQLSDQQMQALRDEWSKMHMGEHAPADADLLASLSDPSNVTNQLIVDRAAGPNATPQDYIRIPYGPLFPGRHVDLSKAQANLLAQQLPGSTDHIDAILRSADRAGVNWQTVAAAAQAYGINTAAPVKPPNAPSGNADPSGGFALPESNQTEGRSPSGATVHKSYVDIAEDVAKYQNQYKDSTLALIAAAGRPDLASKLQADPYNLTSDEGSAVMQIITAAGWDPSSQQALGNKVNPQNFQFITDRAEGVTQNVDYARPDPKALTQSVDTLWRGWFQRAPTAEEAAKFIKLANDAAYQAAQTTKPNPLNPTPGGVTYTPHMQADPSAEAADYARQQPEYQQLFAKRPGNESEDQYVQGITSGVTQDFGQQAAGESDAIRAGMTSGSASTAQGYLAYTEDGRKSATFLERLARASQAIRNVQ